MVAHTAKRFKLLYFILIRQMSISIIELDIQKEIYKRGKEDTQQYKRSDYMRKSHFIVVKWLIFHRNDTAACSFPKWKRFTLHLPFGSTTYPSMHLLQMYIFIIWKIRINDSYSPSFLLFMHFTIYVFNLKFITNYIS